jgi:mRNA-degrading endonuclease RelE of RelBE toxin-antitoxin system
VFYRLRFAESAAQQFLEFNARDRRSMLDQIKQQLQYEPFTERKNRKRLRPNPFAPWELRIGRFRVFYELDAVDSDLVNVLAVGIKKGNRLFIAGKEVRL